MNRFWGKSKSRGLDGALVRTRPTPPDNLVASVVDRIHGSRERRRAARLGAALAAAGLALVALGAGGAGYAYSSGSASANKTSAVRLHQTGVIKRPSSASDAQYGPVSVPPYPPPKPTPPPGPSPQPPSPGHPGGGTGGQPAGGKTKTTTNVAGGGYTKVKSNGNLPFTGLSLAVPAIVGIALMALGFTLRRRGRVEPQ